MERSALRHHPTAVAGNLGVHPVVVHIAIERLAPETALREADGVVVFGGVRKIDHDHDVKPHAGDPSLKGEHAVLIVHVSDFKSLASQRRLLPVNLDELRVKRKKSRCDGSDELRPSQ